MNNIQIMQLKKFCQMMISFINHNFAQAMECAESALAAAEKAFQEEPSWFGYQKALLQISKAGFRLRHNEDV